MPVSQRGLLSDYQDMEAVRQNRRAAFLAVLGIRRGAEFRGQQIEIGRAHV